MTLFHRSYSRKGKDRNIWVYWVAHSGFGKPKFRKEAIAVGYPWECIGYTFTWGKLEAYIAMNSYTRGEIKRGNDNLKERCKNAETHKSTL